MPISPISDRTPGKPDRAPVVTPPPAVDLEATGLLTAVTPEQLGTATARDDRDQSPAISNDSPGSFSVGNHTVTWTATDDTGNAGTAAQRVTIRDTTPPAITLTGDIKVTVKMGVTPEELRSAVAATCTDLVDGDLPITSNGVVDPNTPGEYVVKQSCTDAAGNPASVTRTVTVVAPVSTQPTDLEAVERDMSGGWRMMTVNWTEPGQPPASGYNVTVWGSDGTPLPLSQFEILIGDYDRYIPHPNGWSPGTDLYKIYAYNMDGSRNPQGDIELPPVPSRGDHPEVIDVHNNTVYVLYNGANEVVMYNLDGVRIGDFEIGLDSNNDRMYGLLIHDGKAWTITDEVHTDPYGVALFSYEIPNWRDPVGIALEQKRDYKDVTELDSTLYVLHGYRVSAYESDGTYVDDKSFNIVPDPYGFVNDFTSNAATGTLWMLTTYTEPQRDEPQYDQRAAIHVYSPTADNGTQNTLFSFRMDVPQYADLGIAFTTPVISDTITVPAGTNRTAYYYYAPVNEDITHTVQTADPSSDPPATMTTRRDVVPVDVFHDSFDSGLSTWTYQEHPYGSLNTMFCDDDVTGTYTLAHSADNSGSAHVARANVTDMCWFGSAGLARTFDVPAGHDGGDLTVTLGYKSQAGLGLSLIEFICSALGFCTGGQDGLGAQGAATDMADAAAQTGQILGRHANNLFYTVTDSAGNDLANGQLFPGDRSVPKVGASWNTATISVPSLDAATCPCEIEVYTTDLDWDAFNKRFSIDNVNATMTRP